MRVEITRRYINPYTDYGFKYLFGTEPNKELTLDFVNALLQGRDEGRDEGRAEGRAEERIANARSLIANGVPKDIIINSLGLTSDEIELL